MSSFGLPDCPNTKEDVMQLPLVRARRALGLLCMLAALPGCPDSTTAEDAPTFDTAEPLDARDDASTPPDSPPLPDTSDAAEPLDTSDPMLDAGADADLLLDSGIDAALPMDAGTDAPVLNACTTAGATRIAPCGDRCGMASQRCSPTLVWENTSACLAEGECSSGTAEMRTTARCAEETRLCNATCTWTAWLPSRPETGVCAQGERRFVPDSACGAYRGRWETCSATCAWDSPTACTDGCDDTARTSPAWSRELCIPAGTFIRGTDDPTATTASRPEAEIYVSAFYLDVYTVTNGRYRACVDAGYCMPPGAIGSGSRNSYNDPTRDSFPLESVNHLQAANFCNWDEGRRLATDAELAKAARGAAPRRDLYPWGATVPDCAVFFTTTCGYVRPPPYQHSDPFDGLPETRSPFGIERLLGGGFEFTGGRYQSTYYSLPESLVADPPGPSSSALPPEIRGSLPRTLWPQDVTDRSSAGTDSYNFRCARSL